MNGGGRHMRLQPTLIPDNDSTTKQWNRLQAALARAPDERKQLIRDALQPVGSQTTMNPAPAWTPDPAFPADQPTN